VAGSVSRAGLGGSGFLGFLLRWIVTVLIVWILTVIVAGVVLLLLNVSVDLLGGFTSPLRLAENSPLLGAAALILGWVVSMAIAYLTVWRGSAFG
jgi:uncharacterized metal-binding protein